MSPKFSQTGPRSPNGSRSPKLHLTPLVAAVLAAVHGSASGAEEEDDRRIEEIIVTATKRAADMQDVAQSITAFTEEDLARLGARDMKEYIDALPSVALVNAVPGRNSVVFRGVSTGSSEYRTDSMTAVYLDEQPLTTNSQQVDPWLVDIERVEALPGPQGTLFGSSSQSGTLRVITNKPNPAGFSSQLDVGGYATQGGEPSFDLSGHLNVPLSERLAVRGAGYYSREGGYVDNVLGMDVAGTMDNSDVVEDDFNDYDVYGGRLAAAWDVSEHWSVLASAIGQGSEAQGSWESDPALGDFKITKFFDEYREDDWYQVAMTISGDLGFAEFSATTAQFDRKIVYEWDNMLYEQYKDAYFGAYSGYDLYNSEYTFGTTFNDQDQERLSQEVRLTSTGASRFQWMIGGFYEDVEDQWLFGAKNDRLADTLAWEAANYYAYNYYSSYDGIDYPLPPTDIGFSNRFERAVTQRAAFGELSYDLSEQLTAGLGMRWFEYDRNEFDRYNFPQGLPPLSALELGGAYRASGVESDTAFKLNVQYRVDNDRMIYALFSQGFRLGGSNSQRAAATGRVPLNYSSDKLNNYELGIKSDWADGRLRLNLSAFYMVWEDIQLNNDGGVEDQWWLRGILNGDTAETKGVELNWEAQPGANWRIEGSIFRAAPEFSSEFTLLSGSVVREGTTMPISPEFKFWLAVEYSWWSVAAAEQLWIRYDTSYQSSVYNGLEAAIAEDPDGRQPSWTMANLQLGASFDGGLDVTFVLNNVWDQRTINYLDNGGNYQAAWFEDPRYQNVRSYARPRAVGVSISKRF